MKDLMGKSSILLGVTFDLYAPTGGGVRRDMLV